MNHYVYNISFTNGMIKLAGHINTQALSTLHIPERAKHTQLRNEKGQFLINSDKD